MKTRKLNFSLSMKIIAVLSCIAIASAGFASWWIVKTPTVAPQNGSFTVYTVTEKEIQISTPTFTNSTIIFGKPSAAVTPTWLIASSDVATENLVATMSFTVNIKDDSTTTLSTLINSIDLVLAPNDAAKANFNAAIDANYIAAPVVSGSYTYVENSETKTQNLTPMTYSTDANAENKLTITAPAHNSITVTLTFTFGWGSVSNSQNPYQYYNAQDYAAKYTEAKALLEAIALIGNTGYNVTLSTAVKSN